MQMPEYDSVPRPQSRQSSVDWPPAVMYVSTLAFIAFIIWVFFG